LNQVDVWFANCEYGNFSKVKWREAILLNVVFNHTNLSAADFERTSFCGEELGSCEMRNANLSAANLRGCDLRCVNLTGANLRGADLSGADLFGVTLTSTILTDVIWDQETRWPDGFDITRCTSEE